MSQFDEFLKAADGWTYEQAQMAARIEKGVSEGSLTAEQGRRLLENIANTESAVAAANGNRTRTRLLQAIKLVAKAL